MGAFEEGGKGKEKMWIGEMFLFSFALRFTVLGVFLAHDSSFKQNCTFAPIFLWVLLYCSVSSTFC